MQKKFDAEDWLRLVDTHKVTTTFSAPTPVRLICNLPTDVKAKYDRSSMRRFIANAAPWSFALKQLYLADFPGDSLFEVYGSTELGVNTILRPEDQLRKPGSCGKPAPMVEIVLFDDDGKRVTEPRVPGELAVRSPSVFATYHKAQDKFDEDKRGDFHTVGDVAYFDEEGFYYICDRKKDMIISGGVNIYPAEIEAVLDAHPDVLDVAVIGVPSDEWGESVHAVIVPLPDKTLDRRRHPRLRPRAPRRLQDPALRLVHRRDPAQRVGEDPQEGVAAAVLGGADVDGLRDRGRGGERGSGRLDSSRVPLARGLAALPARRSAAPSPARTRRRRRSESVR